MIDPELLGLAVTVILGTGGAARIGTKSALNGIYKRLDRHEGKLDKITDTMSEHGERIAKVEAKHE